MKILSLIFLTLFIFGCRSSSDKTLPVGEDAGKSEQSTTVSEKKNQFAVGDKAIYLSSSGQRFYEGEITEIKANRAKLKYADETVESDVSELYRIPEAGTKVNVKPGEIVASRFGRSAVWIGSEVVKVEDDRITVKLLSTGKTEVVAPESILILSPATQVIVKSSFQT